VEIEWPPRSGKKITIPEIDRAAFFNLGEASKKLNPAQVPFLTRLKEIQED
jgi:predicted NUDIX family NTP pyrophosphohydrolase